MNFDFNTALHRKDLAMFTGTSATLGAVPVLNGETIFLDSSLRWIRHDLDRQRADRCDYVAAIHRPNPSNSNAIVMTLTADTPTTSVPTTPLTPAMTVLEALLKQPIDPPPDPCGFRDRVEFGGITIPWLVVDARFARLPSRSTRQRPVDTLELS